LVGLPYTFAVAGCLIHAVGRLAGG
jgi:hypothetical protein